MRPADAVVEAPGGRFAPLRRATSPEEVGRAIAVGVIVETDPDTAVACGACFDDPEDAEEAFDAAEDPAVFGNEEGAGCVPS